MTPCQVTCCTLRARRSGYCIKHFKRLQRHGEPLIVKPGGRPLNSRHGTASRYNYGCRCKFCTRAKSDAGKERRHRLGGVRPDVPVEPLRELVECLVSFGVSKGRIAYAIGNQTRGLKILKGATAEAGTKDKLETLHWGLWRRHGPFRIHCGCAMPEEIRDKLEAS